MKKHPNPWWSPLEQWRVTPSLVERGLAPAPKPFPPSDKTDEPLADCSICRRNDCNHDHACE